MKARMGAVRGLCLGATAAMVTAGLGVVAAPAAHAVDPVFPAPDSASWLQLKHGGAVLTDDAKELDGTHQYLELTAAGGANGTAAGFVSADVRFAYFRFHVAAVPTAGATGGYVVQFDTDGQTSGWERALRYDPASGTVGVYQGDNSSVNAKSAPVKTIAIPASSQLAATSADGGAWVAFAIGRTPLADAGIKVGAPMVLGTTTETIEVAGAGLNHTTFLGLGNGKADALGAGKTTATWTSIASDPLTIDSDSDGIADSVDNCGTAPNPGQEDDDGDHVGNVCDTTPRGEDPDGDGVGLLDDNCPEQYGLDANGCVAQSITTALLRYKASKKRFSGIVTSDYDQCNPRRNVTIYRLVKGPDAVIGKVKSDPAGKFALTVKRKPKAGNYYAYVDPKWTLGARCFGVKAAKIKIG